MEPKVGDIVKLKSGGPKMTLTELGKYRYADHEQAKCTWFDGNKKNEDIFEKDTLKVVMQSSVD